MADKQMYPVNLYDANGGYLGQVEHDEDVSADRARPMTVGGKTYVYQARSDRWTEVGEAYEVKGKPKLPDQDQSEPIQMGVTRAPEPAAADTRQASAKP